MAAECQTAGRGVKHPFCQGIAKGWDEMDLEELKACELRVWEALRRGDGAADAAALADGFLGVYPDGFAGKAAHVGQLDHGRVVERYTLSDWRGLALGGDHALISYRAEFLRVGKEDIVAMYVSSIWQRQGSGWVNLFSQDTPAQDQPVDRSNSG
ncbi:MAG: DUF4440 domain-containing protein [Pseudomonadota bacterium]